MQDEISDEEAIAVTRTMLLKNVPTPALPEVLSGSGSKRLQDFGLVNYAKHLSEIGVGFNASGRIAIVDPVFADQILQEFNLLSPSDVAIALTCTSFAEMTIITKAGHEIVINPLMETLTVFEGVPDEARWVELDLASTIGVISDSVHGPDRQTGNDGKDLHAAAEKRFGKLEYGSCFMLPPHEDKVARFSAQALEVGSAISYILNLRARGMLEIARIPYSPPENDSGSAWGDDWED